MLSGESATGEFPVESVATLAKIAAATEPYWVRADIWERLKTLPRDVVYSSADLLSLSVEAVITASSPAAVVVPTYSGATARAIARFHLPVWVAAPTADLSALRRLQFTYGVEPIFMEQLPPEWTAFTRDWIDALRLAGNVALLVEGPSPTHPQGNHLMEILQLEK
jgi:pyruvate kinase